MKKLKKYKSFEELKLSITIGEPNQGVKKQTEEFFKSLQESKGKDKTQVKK